MQKYLHKIRLWYRKTLRKKKKRGLMFDYIEEKIDAGVVPDTRDSEILFLRTQLEDLKAKSLSGRACVENVLQKGIEWYDPTTMSYQEQVSYKADAVSVLKNATLLNELRHFESDLVAHIATQSKSFEEVMNLRMGINVLALLMERLESIPDPRDTEEPAEDPFETL
jgi:hypothetical protein